VSGATGCGRVIPARVRPQTSQTYFHRNQQYSIVGLTNAVGTLVERYTYSAYGTLGIYAANGSVRSSSPYANRYTYTGREWDAELRLYHFRARWYDPATGGFVTRDPLGYVDGMSLYRGYFGIIWLDPHGTMRVDDEKDWDGIPLDNPYSGKEFGDQIWERVGKLERVGWLVRPTEAKGMAWRDPTENERSHNKNSYAETKQKAGVGCSCLPCDCHDPVKYYVYCDVKAVFEIVIYRGRISEPMRIEWAYGHEQVYVNNMIELTMTIAEGLDAQLKKLPCMDETECNEKAAKLSKATSDTLSALFKNEGDHGVYEHPKKKTGYKPIDDQYPKGPGRPFDPDNDESN
jgi:RHS repeat-associated protein